MYVALDLTDGESTCEMLTDSKEEIKSRNVEYKSIHINEKAFLNICAAID